MTQFRRIGRLDYQHPLAAIRQVSSTDQSGMSRADDYRVIAIQSRIPLLLYLDPACTLNKARRCDFRAYTRKQRLTL